MEKTLASHIIEGKKSTFIVDLIEHFNQKKSIKISQTIHENLSSKELNINETVLGELIDTLQDFYLLINGKVREANKNTFSEKVQKEVIRRYFNGISIEDIAIQFNTDKNQVETLFKLNNIEIVSNEIPTHLKKRSNKKNHNAPLLYKPNRI